MLAGAGTTALVLRGRGHKFAKDTRSQISRTLSDNNEAIPDILSPVVDGGKVKVAKDFREGGREQVFGGTDDPPPETFEKKLDWLEIWHESMSKAAIWPRNKYGVVEMDMDFNYVRKQFKKKLQEIIDTVLLNNPMDRPMHITQISEKLGIDNGRLADLSDEIYAEEMADLHKMAAEIAAAEQQEENKRHSFDWEKSELRRRQEDIEKLRRFSHCVRNDQCDPYPSGVAIE